MKNRKPAWWQLYLIFPVMFVLLAFERLWPVPWASAEVADAGIVVLSFVAALAWVQFNGGLLEQHDFNPEEYARSLQVTVYRPNSLPEPDQFEGDLDKDDPGDEEASTPLEGRAGPVPSEAGQTKGRPRKGDSQAEKDRQKWFLN